MNNESFAIRDEFSNDLEVRLGNNGLRFVITDTLPWTDDEMIAAHLEIISARVDSYMQIATSDRFRQGYPATPLDKVSIVLRFRFQPALTAEPILFGISKRLATHGIRFRYGMASEYRKDPSCGEISN
ncbi:hypothetical protein EN852_001985 [Mesorhizobium sp. M2E.F.Ca.ET.209.01.1.1]|uniref:DUF6572 domain-containing protein n=1 Tax=Mesorhizobium sp. M2E.F.Ca.ET.209.01.1.1 TaxID=2500526 RepID=UPI000FD7192F|nr:DUF6572 domain-containing protein [Mesorhizobium sp. M2E.F.Ca.ET.209.01.1.1]TGS19117.1 hypothetical protein EN852_001985 [Mesorhizobium sp. M2E.F.Ca.ET.209.01.1.1]